MSDGGDRDEIEITLSGLPADAQAYVRSAMVQARAQERNATVVAALTDEVAAQRAVLAPILAGQDRWIHARAACLEAATAALKAAIAFPGTVVNAITQGNKIAQTVLATGIVVFVLTLAGIQFSGVDVTRLLGSAFGVHVENCDAAPATPAPAPATPPAPALGGTVELH